MSVDQKSGAVTINCDNRGCRTNIDGEGSFEAVWAEAKAEGWKALKTKNRWVHYCPSCFLNHL